MLTKENFFSERSKYGQGNLEHYYKDGCFCRAGFFLNGGSGGLRRRASVSVSLSAPCPAAWADELIKGLVIKVGQIRADIKVIPARY